MKFLIAMNAGEARDSFFTPKALNELRKYGEVIICEDVNFSSGEEIKKRIEDVDVLFSGWGTARIDSDILSCAEKLKIHAHTGGAVASYVTKEEYDRGIVVLSGNDVYAQSVAEGCLLYTMMGLRRADKYINTVRSGGWRPAPDFSQGLFGKKVGVVGYGAIAKYFIEFLQGFNVELYIYSKYISDEYLLKAGAKRSTLEEIFSTCDIISLHSALNQENRGMIKENHLQAIKQGALLINTARAGLVDDEALIRELKTERFNAVLDVFVNEPLEADSPYRSLPNVIPFPHAAGPTFDMRERVVFELLNDVLRFENNEPVRNAIPYDYAIRMTVT